MFIFYNAITGGGCNMKIYKAYKYRLYPTEEQKILIYKTFGCSRFVYNHYLDYEKKNGVKKAYDL